MSTISSSTTSTTAYKVTADTTGTLVIQTGATPTTAVTVDASQNVGIGVTPNTWNTFTSNIQGSGYALSGFGATGNTQTSLATNAYYNTGWKYIQSGTTAATQYLQINGAHTWSYAAGGTAGNAITFNEAMRIDSSGNVGIGTSSPSVKLEVSGPVYSTQNNYIRIGNAYLSSGGDYCHLANNTYFNGSVWTSSANGAMYQMTGQAHNWYTQTSNAFTAVAVITSTGNFQFNSGYGSVATAYGCRAWVNFNGTGTVAIRSSGNVTSITDNGVGDYTVNFTNAMTDANYSMTSSSANTGPTMSIASPQLAATPFTTTTARVETRNTSTGAFLDCQFVCLGFFR